MRLQAGYILENRKLPVEYRRGFVSLLKEAIKQENPIGFHLSQKPDLQPVGWWVKDLECDGGIPEWARKRLMRWCRDIYFADYEYDKTRGVIVSAPWDQPEAVIL